MFLQNIGWIVKLTILLVSVQLSTNQKYGYYLTSTCNITSTQAAISSKLINNISQIAKSLDIEVRGTILNLRNNNKTGDIFAIIYSKETSLDKVNNVLINLSNKLTDMIFFNTNISLLYFVAFDVEISSIHFNEKYTNTSSKEYMDILNLIKSNPEFNSLGIHLFDPPILTFNKLFIRFQNKPGNLRGTLFSTVYSLNDYPSSTQLKISFPIHLTNFNSTIYHGFWDKISIYSTTGSPIYEFYFIASFKSMTPIIQQSDIDLISIISGKISNALLTYGVGFNGEILHINNSTFTIDYHGSLFRGNQDLMEINYIVSMVLSTVSSVTFTNFKIYNIYRASIYAYLDNNIYNLNNYLNNSVNLQEILKNEIFSRLFQENMFLMNGNYFDFIFQWQAFENRLRVMTYFLIYTEKTSLFDVENIILNIFYSLPSIVDPFNSYVDRAEKLTTGIYPNYTIPNLTFNISTDSYRITKTIEISSGRLTTIHFSTIPTTSTSTIQITTTKMPTTSTSTVQTSTTTVPTTSSPTIQTTTTTMPTTSTSTVQTSTATIRTTSTPTILMTTTKMPTTSTSTVQTSTTTVPTTNSPTIQTTTTKIPTTSTSTTKTTTTTRVITTQKPPGPGETKAVVDMKCRIEETYKDTYSDEKSDDYKSFTKKMTNDLDISFIKNGKLRLISIKYNSIRSGSVIVNFTLTTASNTTVNSSQISNNVNEITSTTFGPNSTIAISVTSIEIVTSIAPETTTKPWKNGNCCWCKFWNNRSCHMCYISCFILSWIFNKMQKYTWI